MASKKNKKLLTLAGGLAVGAAIGLLFTTEKGYKIRRTVGNKTRGLADRINHLKESTKNGVEKITDREILKSQ